MSGAIQPFRRPPTNLPRSTFGMQRFDQTPLGQKALQERQRYFSAGAQPKQTAGYYGDRSVGTPVQPNLSQRLQQGSPVSQGQMVEHTQQMLQRPLTGNQQLRANAQAFNRTENQPGGWMTAARNERTEGAPGYNPAVAAQQNAKIAALIPRPQVTGRGGELVAELQKAMPIRPGLALLRPISASSIARGSVTPRPARSVALSPLRRVISPSSIARARATRRRVTA